MADKHNLTEDEKVLHGMGYAQELARRMSGFSNFAISFSIICILAGGITAFPVAMSSGGGFSVSIGWIIGGLFALVVAASVGQIASAYPTAGGLYHWASILGGRGWGWLCAWINLVGLIFVVASVNFGVYLLMKDLLLTGVFGMDTSTWGAMHASIFVSIFAITQALFNHFGIKTTTMLTDFSGYLIFVVAILLTLSMLIWGAGFDLSRLTTFVNNTGEPGGLVVPEPRTALVAFLIGLLYPLYTITGFDASAHTSEETMNARTAVPKGMLHSVFWSLLFGFFLAASFVLAMPDTAAGAKEGFNSFFSLYNSLPMPFVLKAILALGIVVANYICALAGMTSTSRMIYAFARDGGLPASKALSTIHPQHRTPVNAIWLTAVLSAAACFYAPFMFALAAGCALFLYISYAMPVAAGLLAEGQDVDGVRTVPPWCLVEALGGYHHHWRGHPRLCRYPTAVQPDHPATVPGSDVPAEPAHQSADLPGGGTGSGLVLVREQALQGPADWRSRDQAPPGRDRSTGSRACKGRWLNS